MLAIKRDTKKGGKVVCNYLVMRRCFIVTNLEYRPLTKKKNYSKYISKNMKKVIKKVVLHDKNM